MWPGFLKASTKSRSCRRLGGSASSLIFPTDMNLNCGACHHEIYMDSTPRRAQSRMRPTITKL